MKPWTKEQKQFIDEYLKEKTDPEIAKKFCPSIKKLIPSLDQILHQAILGKPDLTHEVEKRYEKSSATEAPAALLFSSPSYSSIQEIEKEILGKSAITRTKDESLRDFMTRLTELGIEYFQIGNFQKALEIFTEVEKNYWLEPANLHLLNLHGRVRKYSSLSQQQILKTKPKEYLKETLQENYQRLIVKGLTQYRLGHFENARQVWEQALEIDAQDSDTLFRLACVCSILKDDQAALNYLEKSIQLRPINKDFAKSEKSLARLHANQKFQEILHTAKVKSRSVEILTRL